MAVLIEPSRGRPSPARSPRYPGLTPEERGFDALPIEVPPTDPGPPPPLWVVPRDPPRSSGSVGFVGPLPEVAPRAPPEEEGLFDVPGLLERLWLARALEARRETPRAPKGATVAEPGPTPPPSLGPAQSGALAARPPAARPEAPLPGPASAPPPATAGPPVIRPSSSVIVPNVPLARSWVCPYCYLANNPSSSICRGCRNTVPHG